MKGREEGYRTQQADYLLDYDRRNILRCADTFEDLALAVCRMDREREQEESKDGDREELWRQRRAQEGKRARAFYLKQASDLMQSVARTKVQILRLGGRQEKMIVRALAGEGILVKDICLIKGAESEIEICVCLCTKKKISVTAAELADYLSVLMDIRLVSEKGNPYFVGEEPVTLYFEKEPDFCCMTASATAIRENEAQSGDSFSFFEEDGKMTIILSDGVGSGEEAARDSSRIVDLTERILSAGLSCQATVDMLNGMFCESEEEIRMPTLDLCRIDLKKGVCSIAKAGGVSTFIKRGQLVEKVSVDSLPLGLSQEPGGGEIERPLKEGDMVILLTDGVVEDWPCMDGEFFLMQQMEQMTVTSPVDMANLLLQYAIGQSQGRIRDDMTVLVAGIWGNAPK